VRQPVLRELKKRENILPNEIEEPQDVNRSDGEPAGCECIEKGKRCIAIGSTTAQYASCGPLPSPTCRRASALSHVTADGVYQGFDQLKKNKRVNVLRYRYTPSARFPVPYFLPISKPSPFRPHIYSSPGMIDQSSKGPFRGSLAGL
jgi:hypothetical protein